MSRRMSRGAILAGLAFALLASGAVRPADIVASLPITKVTVYRDSAIVTRTGTLDVPAGDQRLIVRNLPGGLNPASLRLTARAQNVRLGGVEVQHATLDEAVNENERTLNRKLLAVGDQKSAVEDEIAAAQTQLKLVASVAEKTTSTQRLPSAELGALVAGVGASDSAARTRIRNARVQLRQLDDQLEVLKAELQKVAMAEVYATDFVADYRIPGQATVMPDRESHLYPIGDDELDVDLVSRANMAASPTAFLEAKITYKGDVPIDAGQVQLYRDDAFIGVAGLPLVLPGDDVRLPFGVDQRVRIAVRDEREESGDRGILSRQQVNQRKRRYEVTSFHASAFPIEIVDRIPVPRNADIRVEVLEGATPPTIKDLDGLQGVYLWRLPGTPRKMETIRHYYSVRYPGDQELVPSETN